MPHAPKSLALAIGATVAAGALFSMDALAGGYMQDAPAKTSESKAGEGKCGEGKCAAGMKPAAGKDHAGTCSVASMDSDKDGRISRTEFAAAHGGKADKFAAHDSNGDGFITQAELDAHHAGKPEAKPESKAAGEGKCGEGKCGEGKCGGNP